MKYFFFPTEISNNASLLNIYVTDLLPLMNLGRRDLDEDIISPTNLQCIVDHKNMKLESHGYKIGTSSIDYYKPKQIGMIRSLSNDGKQLILTLVFKIIKKNMPLIPVELIDVAESSTYEYLNEGYSLIQKKMCTHTFFDKRFFNFFFYLGDSMVLSF